MPMIYRRFTEKAAEEWRQIYKALQLLEFLIKHGSERVIDDARGHLTLLKMLRQFHYIDLNGKDQGINVRNRAKELADLLGDVDKIRQERKKARATKNKYTGVEGGVGGGFSSGGSGSRYGGFGSESAGYGDGGGGNTTFGGYSGGVYGDGGGFGGQESDFREGGSGSGSGSRSERFEAYDEFDEGDRPVASSSRTSRRSERAAKKAVAPTEPPKKKEPEVDLFSFDEPVQTSSAPILAPSNGSGLAALANDEDDEFDDFQSADPPAATSSSFAQPLSPPVTATASSTAHFASPQPQSAPQQANLSSMVNLSSISPATSTTGTPGANYSAFTVPMAPSQPAKAPGFAPSGPNYFGGMAARPSAPASNPMAGIPALNSAPSTMANTKPVTSPTTAKPAVAGGDAFGALWGKASSGIKKNETSTGPALGQLAKEKSSAGIWGAPASHTLQQQQPAKQGGSALDDLLG